jgi:hypothetical protein
MFLMQKKDSQYNFFLLNLIDWSKPFHPSKETCIELSLIKNYNIIIIIIIIIYPIRLNDMILNGTHPGTIYAKFGSIWPSLAPFGQAVSEEKIF